ncbi:MAG: sulfotransferase [Verrucomicrobiota bacterium]
MEKFFIFGCPRSGTTLFQEILDQHPKIAVLHETRFMRTIWAGRYWRYVFGERWIRQHVLNSFFEEPNIKVLGLDSEMILDSWEKRQTRSFMGLMDELMVAYGTKCGASIVGEKTPIHLGFAEALAEAFPEAPLFCLVRDPRAVVSSWNKLHGVSAVEGNASRWCYYWDYLQSCLARGLPIRVIRYEELLLNYQNVITDVLGDLDVPMVDEVAHFNGGKGKLIPPKESHKDNVFKPIITDRISSWESELDELDIAKIEGICGYRLEDSGYQPKVGSRPGACTGSVRWRSLKARFTIVRRYWMYRVGLRPYFKPKFLRGR